MDDREGHGNKLSNKNYRPDATSHLDPRHSRVTCYRQEANACRHFSTLSATLNYLFFLFFLFTCMITDNERRYSGKIAKSQSSGVERAVRVPAYIFCSNAPVLFGLGVVKIIVDVVRQ